MKIIIRREFREDISSEAEERTFSFVSEDSYQDCVAVMNWLCEPFSDEMLVTSRPV